MSDLTQWLIVAIAGLVALGFVVRKYFPQWVRGTRQTIAIALLRNDATGLRRRLGLAIAPPSVRAAAKCETDCGGCD